MGIFTRLYFKDLIGGIDYSCKIIIDYNKITYKGLVGDLPFRIFDELGDNYINSMHTQDEYIVIKL